MRPDKHKKKQHAAYAKKTAQKNKKSGNTSNDTTNTNSQPRSKPRTSGNTSENSVRADDIGFTIESKQFKGSSRNELSLNSNLTEDKDVSNNVHLSIQAVWYYFAANELVSHTTLATHRTMWPTYYEWLWYY